jgi:hypothetical protein
MRQSDMVGDLIFGHFTFATSAGWFHTEPDFLRRAAFVQFNEVSLAGERATTHSIVNPSGSPRF